MKIAHMFAAAGLVVASLGVSTVAEARQYHEDHGRGDRDRGRDYRHDDGNRHGWRGRHGHNRCRVEWRHHHRVRVCR